MHALETWAPREDLTMSRVAFAILGVIPIGAVEISARVLRPGRTVKLLEAEMTAIATTAIAACRRSWPGRLHVCHGLTRDLDSTAQTA